MTTPATIRHLYRDAVLTLVSSVAPWHEFSFPPDLFDSLRPELSEVEADYGFGAHLPATDREQTHGQSWTTVVELLWSVVIGAQDQVADYDAALALEATILAVISRTAGKPGVIRRIERKVTTGAAVGLFVERITIEFLHQY